MTMAIADDLLQIADSAFAALDRIRDPNLQASLASLGKACEDAKKAWSGSNIGYHANVYFAGLQPKPPDAEFSPEWGLKDLWPTHRPHPGWQTMDRDAVVDAILSRAGKPDITNLEGALIPLKDMFFKLKEQAISLLSAALTDTDDQYIARKLKQVEPLIYADARTIALDLLPKGQPWTRDSLAATQGLQVAPHQSLIALRLSATVLENGLGTLESATREAASHLNRLDHRTKRGGLTGTNVFIGHGRSAAWRELKDFVEDRLHIPVDEFNRVPIAGLTTTARLSELLNAAAFAFLVMTGEDEQADGKVRARENVVHEVGLFQGRLGFTKAIILLEDGCQEFSNIYGLGQIRFPAGKISAKFEDIRGVLEREGLI